MSKERYNQIVDEVYGKYADSHWSSPENPGGPLLSGKLWSVKPMEHSKESFIRECKTNIKFSEKWGLKIEERELSLEERVDYFNSKMIKEGIRTQIGMVGVDESYWRKALEETNHDIPTRVITVTYKGEKLEFYE